MNPEDNPLLNLRGMPQWDALRPDHFALAISKTVSDLGLKLADLEHSAVPSWEGCAGPLQELLLRLQFVTWPLEHLCRVARSEVLLEAWRNVAREVASLRSEVRASRKISSLMKALAHSPEFERLSPSRRAFTRVWLRESKMGGSDLDREANLRFVALQGRLKQIASVFEENHVKSRLSWHRGVFSADEISGTPLRWKEWAADDFSRLFPSPGKPAERHSGPWLVTLTQPQLTVLLATCDHRQLRKEVFQAERSIASEGELDNGPLMKEAVSLRRELAQVAGYESYAELAFEGRMAPHPDEVVALLDSILEQTREQERKERQRLKEFAEGHGHQGPLEAWDVVFWREKLLASEIGLDSELLRPWFPFPCVLDGLLELCHTLFGLTLQRTHEDLWHPDVLSFKVNGLGGEQIARYLLDPYARPGRKRGGAWMDTPDVREIRDGSFSLPVACNVLNLPPPTTEMPSLLSLDEVRCLFHEFGHALHHMLATGTEPLVSGLAGSEFDALEIPSKFMEFWLSSPNVIGRISRHAETGEEMPSSVKERILRLRQELARGRLRHQALLALVDLEIYGRNSTRRDPQAILHELAQKYDVGPLWENDRSLCAFGHIFENDYEAGYYSYIWSEIIAADLFAEFPPFTLGHESRIRECGRRLVDTVLSAGATCPMQELVHDFLGRKPDLPAFFKLNEMGSDRHEAHETE